MPEGPLGVRRPAVDADVVILATVESIETTPLQIERVVEDRGNMRVDGISMDSSVKTYGFSISMDTVSWEDMQRAKSEIQEVLEQFGMEVEGYAVTAR